jgi:hypothetical protein
MKVSTKFRIKYLILFAVLIFAGYLSFAIFDNPGVYIAAGIFVLFIGQLIILGTSSEAQCPICKAYIFNMESNHGKYTMGYQSVILNLLSGRCSSCKSKL